jgi:hypothetical protein
MTKATAFGDLPPELQQQAQALHALVRRGKHADASDGLAAIVRDQKGFPFARSNRLFIRSRG